MRVQRLRLNPLKAKTVAEFERRRKAQPEPCMRKDPKLARYKHLGLSGWVCQNCGHVSAPD